MLKVFRTKGIDAVGFKPVECGEKRTDSTAIFEICGESGVTIDEINPVWFQKPVAPSVAAEIEGPKWDLDHVLAVFEKLKSKHDVVLVEGAGGWLVPIVNGFLVSDLASEIGLPVVVVAANRLGCLNHTSLTVRQIEQDGLKCDSVILNDLPEDGDDGSRAGNETALKSLVSVPILKLDDINSAV
ncbi:UNVERIFIED_CONTAM: hypothetical protein GTU68_017121 [Idotea baltica]|nr:hypothetical protein [Idotea baltica]